MVNEILPDVYDITVRKTPGRRNRVYLFDHGIPTLIDTGYPETVDTLFEGLSEVGQDPERLIVTHGDPDHIGGMDALVDRYGVETWVPEETDVGDAKPPDNRYSHGDVIGPFEAVHTPGHEPDNYSLVDEDRRVLVPGDAIVGSDLRGLPSGYLIPPAAVLSENINEAEKSMGALLEYSFDVVLVFHGTAVVEGGYDRLDRYVNFPGRPDWATY